MPAPVSLIAMRIEPVPMVLEETVTLPSSGVYLTALVSKLSSTC